MNLYFHHFRKKDFESKDERKKKNDAKGKKQSKSTKNAYEQIQLHQLALEHALAYFNKPWDYYLKEKSSSKAKPKRVHQEMQPCINMDEEEEEVNFNSYLMYQNYDPLKSDVIVEAKGGHFQHVLSTNRSSVQILILSFDLSC